MSSAGLLSAGLVVVAVVGVLELWGEPPLLPVEPAAKTGLETRVMPAKRQARCVVVLFMVLLEVKNGLLLMQRTCKTFMQVVCI